MNNNLPKIALDFLQYIEPSLQTLDNPSILLYGSSAYGKTSSDLDICFICENCSNDVLESLKIKTIQFQLENHMILDAEVPYENKLIYTYSEIEQMLKNPPFPYINGKYELTPIEKSKEYMHSQEMKYRLLFNILTTRSLLIYGNNVKIDNYKNIAWENLIKIIVSYNNLTQINLDNIIPLLYKDYKTGAEGELFLGYKTNIPQKQIDLNEDCKKALERLQKNGYISNITDNNLAINVS